MADNYGAKPYDYADYYKPIRGSQLEDTTPFMDKLRAMLSAFGVDQTPVDLNNPNASIGEKLRGGLGLAPALRPTATQADVRKSDMAMAGPGAVVPPVVPTAATPAPVAAPAPAFASAAPTMEPAYTGMTAADIHGTTIPPRGTGAIVNESTGKVTNIGSPTPAGPGAAPQGYQAAPGSLASFYGAGMRMKQAATKDAAARTAALKLPETMKTAEETKKLTELNRLADAEPDPEKRRLILSGLQAPSAAPYTFIPGMNEGEVMVGNRQTGKATTEIAARAPTPLKEGQTGKARDAKGNMVPVVIRNGVPVPI